jgi:hypothetical protein
MTHENCDIIGFCDDTGGLIPGDSIQTIERIANKMLQQINKWAIKAKIEFNANKITAILFTNRRNYTKLNIFLNVIHINIVNEMKYLGLIIDRKLNFNSHVKYITDKCISKIYKLSAIAINSWGLTSRELKILYI